MSTVYLLMNFFKYIYIQPHIFGKILITVESRYCGYE